MVKTLREIQTKFGEDAETFEFKETEDSKGQRIAVIRRVNRGWVPDEQWRMLDSKVGEMGGWYFVPERSWIVPLEASEVSQRTVEPEVASDEKTVLINLDQVFENNYNSNKMGDEVYGRLVENMKKERIDPIEVRPRGDGTWEIIDGKHRVQSARQLGWTTIPCRIRDVTVDRAVEINYAKNQLRGNVDPWLEGELFNRYWQQLGTQEAVAKKFGVSRPYVAERLSLLKVPREVREIVTRVTEPSLLRTLGRLDDPVEQEVLAQKIVEGASVREAEAYVASVKGEEDIEKEMFETSEKEEEVAPPTPKPFPQFMKTPFLSREKEEKTPSQSREWWFPHRKVVPPEIVEDVDNYMQSQGEGDRFGLLRHYLSRLRFHLLDRRREIIREAWKFNEDEEKEVK